MIEIIESLRKYNFWVKKGQKVDIPTGFVRERYLDKIQPYLNTSLIKVLMGQRRVGKSYVLRQVMQHLISTGVHPNNLFYLNKEYIDFDQIQTHTDLAKVITLYQRELHVTGKIYIFLDEVQEIKQWEKVVNSFSQDYTQAYEVFITGSNSSMLSSELSTYLSGRYIAFEVYPFSFQEYTASRLQPKNRESYIQFLTSGGLPELLHLSSEETQREYISSLRYMILLKDIVARFNIKDVTLLENIFSFITDNIGNLTSIQAILHYLKSHQIQLTHTTLAKYIAYLEQAFLIHAVDRFDIKGKAILSGSKKYYLNDLSFRNYLSSHFDSGLGKHLENSIYVRYRALGYYVSVGTIGKEEVDLIAEKNGERQYIQIAYSIADPTVAAREFRSLEKIDDAYPKMIVTLDDVSFGNKNGIQHHCAWELA